MIILFDNNNAKETMKSLWGFSAYFPEYKLLFDTGSNGVVLLQNMRELNIDVKEIEYIFISHSHWDHIGGLDSILALNPNVTLFLPTSLSKHLLHDLKLLAKEVILCTKKPKELLPNLYTTGLLGKEMPEQSLIIDAQRSTLITGCGHFGIENITEVATQVISKKIDSVIGGFHLLRSDDAKIENSISKLKNLGVTTVLPTHCSGDRAIELYKKSFQDNAYVGGVGSKLKLT